MKIFVVCSEKDWVGSLGVYKTPSLNSPIDGLVSPADKRGECYRATLDWAGKKPCGASQKVYPLVIEVHDEMSDCARQEFSVWGRPLYFSMDTGVPLVVTVVDENYIEKDPLELPMKSAMGGQLTARERKLRALTAARRLLDEAIAVQFQAIRIKQGFECDFYDNANHSNIEEGERILTELQKLARDALALALKMQK